MDRKAITKKTFLKAVKHEIDSIKEYATSEEINKLNIHLFNPDDINNCIYGQLTESCESYRAKELMEKGCLKVFDVDSTFVKNKSFEYIAYKIKVNKNKRNIWNKKMKDTELQMYHRDYDYLSALETYIMLDNANNENIIEYLKGETQELNLDTIK